MKPEGTNREKIKRWVKRRSKKLFASSDYYVCRVCKCILPEGEMNPEDKSICQDCAKR